MSRATAENRSRDKSRRGGGPLSRRELLARAGAASAGLGLASAAAPARAATAGPAFRFPATGIELRQAALLLAIDDVSIPLKKDLVLYLSKPKVRPEPVLTPEGDRPDAPDSLATHFYGTVLHDQGKYRMWYYPCNLGPNPDLPPDARAALATYRHNLFLGPLCYAESRDGIRWTKPKLGRVRFKGSRDHNALALPDALQHGAHVIKDDEDPDPARRYKLVYVWYDFTPARLWGSMRTATSADGLDWKAGPREPVADFVEQASLYKHNGLYVVNGQKAGGTYGEGGHRIGRQGFAWVSPDFDHWLAESAGSFSLPEPRDPAARGLDKPYDQVHIGVGAASFGNVLVGLFGRWHNRAAFNEIGCDLGLLVGNDGLAFREPVKGHAFLAAAESPATPVPGRSWPTVLTQGNGIVNVGDETRIYHGRWRNAPEESGYYAEVALATLPRDRWGALGLPPGRSEGSAWTTPITLPSTGGAVALNADGARGMRVEVADERFRLEPLFSGRNGGACQTVGGLDCPVRWPAADLSALAGRTVRLRVHLKREDHPEPRLYAIALKGPAERRG